MQKDKLTLRETLQKNLWAFKLFYHQYPMMFWSTAISRILQSIIPYIGIYLAAQIINELSGARDVERLKKLVIITLVTMFLTGLLQSIVQRWNNACQGAFYFKRTKFYSDKMLDMDFSLMDEQHTHDLRSQITQNERWQGWGLTRIYWIFGDLINAGSKIVGAVVLTVSLFTFQVPEEGGKFVILNSPWFMLAIIVVLIMTTILSPLCSAKASSYWTKQAEDSKMGNRFFMFYGFMGMERARALDIRMYRQDKVCDYFWKNTDNFGPKSKIVKYAKGPMGIYIALGSVISIIFNGIVYVFVCAKAWAGAFGIGSVTQYVGAITALSDGIGSLIRNIGTLRSNAFFLRDAYEYMNLPNEMYQGSLTTEKRSDKKYEVEFRDVSFKYPSSDEYALRHVNVKLKVGKRLAVVGQNGSGKTTFIKLLCRLYDPTEGVILLNGIDIRKYDYKDYISLFSVVFQDFQLMSFPLGQNVAARHDYDRERVKECLREAGFGERLDKMENGLDTYLYQGFDEKGVDVSGGEAQKIALARALYKDAPFIILDEPTAALDPIAEYEVYMSFNDIIKDKTGIYISHRLSSCRFCDEIIVFNEGAIIQQGTHDELVGDDDGKYQELWNAQAQYYAV